MQDGTLSVKCLSLKHASKSNPGTQKLGNCVHRRWATVFNVRHARHGFIWPDFFWNTATTTTPPPFHNVIYWKICIIGDIFTEEIRFHTPEFLTVRELLNSSQQWIHPSIQRSLVTWPLFLLEGDSFLCPRIVSF